MNYIQCDMEIEDTIYVLPSTPASVPKYLIRSFLCTLTLIRFLEIPQPLANKVPSRSLWLAYTILRGVGENIFGSYLTGTMRLPPILHSEMAKRLDKLPC